jgi:hypothetical protein
MPHATLARSRRTGLGVAGLASLLLAVIVPLGSAEPGVIQTVTVKFEPGAVGSTAGASDEVFALTSAGITDDILASIGQPPPGGPGYVATASAGIFGDVGLDVRVFGVAPGAFLLTEVVVGSDEFVNVLGRPVAARSAFIVDGGFIADFFSTNG